MCTLLAHAYQHPSTRLGIVHSLGTNCAYYDVTRNVTKLRMHTTASADSEMIINTEWGNFGSSRRTLPCTWFDRKLDRESINPQFHVFEKMTAGIFLGEIVRNILTYLVDRELLFQGESSPVLNTPYGFDTSYMYVCEGDQSPELNDTRLILEDMMNLSKTSLADREIVKKVCELIGMRAALLVGTAIAAVVQHMTMSTVVWRSNGRADIDDSGGCAICKSELVVSLHSLTVSLSLAPCSHQWQYLRRLSIFPSSGMHNFEGTDSRTSGIQIICWHCQALTYRRCSYCGNDG